MSDILEILRKVAGPKDVDRAADEITRLRAENEKLREAVKQDQVTFDVTWSEADLLRIKDKKQRREIERMREALKPLATAYKEFMRANDVTEYEIANDPYLSAAAAALEGVTEPASPWRDIKCAPKDKEILVFGKKDDGTDYQEVCEYYDAANCWPIVLMHGYLAPTHWMPLPEPPQQSGDIK